jgi:hypothetical protein
LGLEKRKPSARNGDLKISLRMNVRFLPHELLDRQERAGAVPYGSAVPDRL